MTDASCHIPSQLLNLHTEELEEALPIYPFLFLREGAHLQGSARLGPVTLRGQDTWGLLAAPPAPLDCQAWNRTLA